MAQEQKKERLWTSTFLLIMGAVFFLFIAGNGLNTSATIYLEKIGGNTIDAGIAVVIFSVVSAVSRIVTGMLVDKYGRKQAIIVGILIFTVSTALAVFYPTVDAFMVVRFFQGLGYAAASTTLTAAAADVVPIDRLGEGLSYSGIAIALAMSIGPACGLTLVTEGAVHDIFVFSPALAIVTFCAAMFIRYEKHPETVPESCAYRIHYDERKGAEEAAKAAQQEMGQQDQAEKNEKKDKKEKVRMPKITYLVLVPTLLYSGGVGFCMFYAGYYGSALNVPNSGLFFTFSAVSMIAVRAFSSKFIDKYPPAYCFGASCACGVIAFALLLLTPQWMPLYFVAGLFYGVFVGIICPLTNSMGVKYSPSSCWGRASAVNLLYVDIMMTILGMAYGVLIAVAPIQVSMVIAMVFSALSFFFVILFYPDHGLKRVVSYEEQLAAGIIKE